jgi:hypothetical protein
MSDPVSWLLLERGWKVVAADDREVGTVHEVTGDRQADIFDGLAVKMGALGGTRYVPAERVGEIQRGVVQLTVSAKEFEALPAYRDPAPAQRILSESSSLGQRVTDAVRRLFGGR